MKPDKTNPIQQVLQAERDASERIERTRLEAEAAVSDTRRMAKQLLARNEQRTQRALASFEKGQHQLTEAEAERLREQASVELEREQSRIDEKFESLVDQTFDAFWPK